MYKHVAIIGVDGVGAFFKEADTPNMDAIFECGSVTYSMLTSEPTISAECWGSLLLGVTPRMHQLNNSKVGSMPYKTDSIFPSVFRVIHENMPTAELASFSCWNPINVGIVEDGLGVHKDTGGDPALAVKIVDYLKGHSPALLFVQFDYVDGAGHKNGYGTPGHLQAITEADKHIQMVYQAYKDKGILDDTLFIVVADHGGTPKGSHGGSSDAEKHVMFAASGKTVQAGETVDVEIRDLAAIALHALGLTQPKSWTARVPGGLFKGYAASPRPEFKMPSLHKHRLHANTPTRAFKGEGGLANVFPENLLRAVLFFDNDASDATGKFKTESFGKIYYPEGFHGAGVKLDDGCIAIPEIKLGGNSFSVAFWLKGQTEVVDPPICSTKDWNSGKNLGFVLAIREWSLRFNVGNGEKRLDFNQALPVDYLDGWVHVAMAIDHKAAKVRFYIDFVEEASLPLGAFAGQSFDALPFTIGQDGTGKYKYHLSSELDDFILFDGAIGAAEVQALKEYYK